MRNLSLRLTKVPSSIQLEIFVRLINALIDTFPIPNLQKTGRF